jgi:hypothetical protein
MISESHIGTRDMGTASESTGRFAYTFHATQPLYSFHTQDHDTHPCQNARRVTTRQVFRIRVIIVVLLDGGDGRLGQTLASRDGSHVQRGVCRCGGGGNGVLSGFDRLSHCG